MPRRNAPLPPGPMPDEYRTNETTDDHDDDQTVTPQTLPPKNLYGQDLKKLKSYRNLRKNYKMGEIKSAFIKDRKDVSQVLLTLDPKGANKYDSELLIAVLNLAEQFFIYPGKREERDTLKLEAVKELMLPFFDNNEDMLYIVMGTVMNRVIKSNVFKRMWSRAKMYFRA